MKSIMTYLFRSKRGVLWTIVLSFCATLIASVLISFRGIAQYIISMLNPVVREELKEFMDNDPLWDQYFFRYGSIWHIEVVSIIVTAALFVLVCANAFRFGMANSVSRKSIAESTFVSALLTSVVTTLANRVIMLFYTECTYFYWSDSLYIEIFGWHTLDYPTDNLTEVTSLTPPLALREVLVYFAFMLTTLMLVSCMYGLYRSRGVFGLACGTIALTALISSTSLAWDSLGGFSKMFKSLFMYDEGVLLLRDHTYYYLNQPKAAGFGGALLLISAAAAAVYFLSVRKSGIKPKTDI